MTELYVNTYKCVCASFILILFFSFFRFSMCIANNILGRTKRRSRHVKAQDGDLFSMWGPRKPELCFLFFRRTPIDRIGHSPLLVQGHQSILWIFHPVHDWLRSSGLYQDDIIGRARSPTIFTLPLSLRSWFGVRFGEKVGFVGGCNGVGCDRDGRCDGPGTWKPGLWSGLERRYSFLFLFTTKQSALGVSLASSNHRVKLPQSIIILSSFFVYWGNLGKRGIFCPRVCNNSWGKEEKDSHATLRYVQINLLLGRHSSTSPIFLPPLFLGNGPPLLQSSKETKHPETTS